MNEEKTRDQRYWPVKQEVKDEEGNREAYGIAAKENDHVIDQVPDVCATKEKAEYLVRILNEQQVSHVHFREVLQDLIADF